MRYFTSTQSNQDDLPVRLRTPHRHVSTLSPPVPPNGERPPIDVGHPATWNGDQMDEIVTAFRYGNYNNDGTIVLLYYDVALRRPWKSDPTARTLNVGNIMYQRDRYCRPESTRRPRGILDQVRRPGWRRVRQVALGHNLQWAEY